MNIENKKRNIITDPIKVKRIRKHGKLYIDNFNNLDEMENFLVKCNILKLM